MTCESLISASPDSHQNAGNPDRRALEAWLTNQGGKEFLSPSCLRHASLADQPKIEHPHSYEGWNIVCRCDLPGVLLLESQLRLNPGERSAIYTAFQLCLQESQFERLQVDGIAAAFVARRNYRSGPEPRERRQLERVKAASLSA